MNAKDRLEFYKNIHAKEFERKEKIEQALGMPITIIFGLSALLYLMISEFDSKYNSALNWIFLPLLSLAAVALLATIIFAVFAYALAGGYRAEPFANGLEQYRINSESYFQQVSPNNWVADSEKDFIEYLTSLYVSQSSDNTQRNDRRSTWIERVKLGLIASLFFAILGLIPFVINFLNKPDKLYKVGIESLPKYINFQTDSSRKNGQFIRRNCSAAPAAHSKASKACPTQGKINQGRP